MDGVICDTIPHHFKALRVFLERRERMKPEDEFDSHLYGKSHSYIFSRFFGRKIEGEELIAFEMEKEAIFREIYFEHIAPINGLLPFLNQLRHANINMGVATSAPTANMDMILDRLNIRHYFDSLLAYEDVTAHKPDPQVYLRSAQNLKTIPGECLVFEDSFSGANAAYRAGMTVVGVLSTHDSEDLPQCKRHITSYQPELFEWISQQ